jgi:hypothetical protein
MVWLLPDVRTLVILSDGWDLNPVKNRKEAIPATTQGELPGRDLVPALH